ncbi:MAG TPA: hypothetical protein VMD91_00775 [Candidatus Sulfotelmatobacter sp.]|nr:hypothetical protein [Candidatus Sulfotelmatobacter sp.]
MGVLRAAFTFVVVVACALGGGVAGLLAVHGATSPAALAAPAAVAYVPIDPADYISTKAATAIATAQNDAAAQAHAARIWSGLTRRTNQSVDGVRLATYDTWYSPCDVFPDNPPDCQVNNANPSQATPTPAPGGHFALAAQPNPAGRRAFVVPVQFFHEPSLAPSDVFSLVKYNREMASFVGQYANGQQLAALIGQGTAEIPDSISPRAIMTKPVYELLHTTKPTVLQVWAGPGLSVPPSSTSAIFTPGPDTWKTIVVVVPPGVRYTPKPEHVCVNTYDENGNGTGHYWTTATPEKVVPLSDFYALPANAQTIQNVQNARATFARLHRLRFPRLGATASAKFSCPLETFDAGSSVEALVAMHVATAEYPHVWTWETFWYQPLAKGLPGAVGPFAHFDAKTAWWTQDGNRFRYTFNPYLEAGFGRCVFLTNTWPGNGATPGPCTGTLPPASPTPPSLAAGAPLPAATNVPVPNLGRTTNCISCHENATYTVLGSKANPGPGYVAHDKQPQAKVPQSILVLNLWSLANDAPAPPSPSPTATP